MKAGEQNIDFKHKKKTYYAPQPPKDNAESYEFDLFSQKWVKKDETVEQLEALWYQTAVNLAQKNKWSLPPAPHAIIKRWYYNKRTGEWLLWNPEFDRRLQRSSPKYLQEIERYKIDSEKIRIETQKLYAALPKEQKPAWLKGELDLARKPKNVKVEHVWDEYSRKWIPKDITADDLIKHWQEHTKSLYKKLNATQEPPKENYRLFWSHPQKKMDSLDVK